MKHAAAVLLLAFFTAGCGEQGAAAQPPTAPSSASNPTSVGHVVSGVVRARSSQAARPLEGALVSAWIQQTRSGFHFGQETTDAAGRYRFAGVPDGFVILLAHSIRGYDQPCAATVSLGGDAAVDIELVSDDSPLVSMTSGSPTLFGVVFETSSDGRRPVAGAEVYLGGDFDPVIATTTSDADGRYVLCRLPAGVRSHVSASKPGYAITDLAVRILDDTALDIEMSKR